MGNAFSFAWEDKLIIFIQQYMSDTLVKIASLITDLGDQMALIALMGVFYWALNKELGKKLGLYVCFVNVVYPCIKSSVKRLRPYMVNRDIQCLKPVNSDGDIYDVVTQEYSFPSGHANNSIVAYGTLAKRSNKVYVKVLLTAVIVLVGVSRFALGVHYPTDILVGWLVGAIVIALYNVIENKLGRYKTYIFLDVLGLLGFLIAETNDFYTGYGLLLGATTGIMFEEKYVNFGETHNVLRCILRTAIGGGLYLGLNTLLKMPFDAAFLASGTTTAFIVRAVRYAVIAFLLLGVYPMCFKHFDRFYNRG